MSANVRVTATLLAGETEAPRAASGLARFVTHHLLDEVVNRGLDHLALFTFREGRAVRWRLGEGPTDDVVRTIAASEGATGLAFVYQAPVPPEVDGEEAIRVAAESSDGRHDIIIALRGGGAKREFRLYSAEGRPVNWLGVAARQPVRVEVDVWNQAIPEA
jgi:hypothetical protein